MLKGVFEANIILSVAVIRDIVLIYLQIVHTDVLRANISTKHLPKGCQSVITVPVRHMLYLIPTDPKLSLSHSVHQFFGAVGGELDHEEVVQPGEDHRLLAAKFIHHVVLNRSQLLDLERVLAKESVDCVENEETVL